jgi:hypothetical protein
MDYRPTAGGVSIIDNNKQITTKTPNPPTTSMLSSPHSLSAEQFNRLSWPESNLRRKALEAGQRGR